MLVIDKTMEYASKERVLTALHKGIPDRVPVDYSSNSGIDRRLKAWFKLKPDDDFGLKQALGVDFAGVGATYTGPRLHPELQSDIRVNPETGVRTKWMEHESGGYWDFCDFPLQDADLDQIERWPLPSPDDYDYDHLRKVAAQCRNYAVYVGNPGLADVINSNGLLRGMEQVLIDLITDDPAGLRLIERRAELALEVTARALEAANGLIDFLWMGEDLGTQNSPLIGLDLYRKHLRPIHQKFVDLVKSYSLPVMMHCCGSSSWAFEDFIEIGVDAVDTLQPEATNMAPESLKNTFGGRLAFHGCISTAGPVVYGTPDEVIEYCRNTMEIMMPGGGYCFAPTHCLQDNSPTKNVIAMYQAAKDFGRYQRF